METRLYDAVDRVLNFASRSNFGFIVFICAMLAIAIAIAIAVNAIQMAGAPTCPAGHEAVIVGIGGWVCALPR